MRLLERRTSREAPQCTRCITEFQLAFGFPLRTLMIPLDGTNHPDKPGAARKRFTFVDREGRDVWTTSHSRIVHDVFSGDDEVFTVYDVGA